MPAKALCRRFRTNLPMPGTSKNQQPFRVFLTRNPEASNECFGSTSGIKSPIRSLKRSWK